MSLAVQTQSSVVSSAQPPTRSLQDALKLFENELTKEQKQNFLQSNRTFTPSDVVVFIAEIDAANQTGRRSASSRLFTFLDSVQQFVSVIDTFISSNPAIAALVWGGVKGTLIIANNSLQYFDKVAAMITEIGKQSPTYIEFGRLYQNDHEVQTGLCDYYAIIVHICTAVVKLYSRQGLIPRFLSSFETHFKPLLDNLEKERKRLHVHLYLASQKMMSVSTQKIDQEMKANTKYRRKAAQFQSTALQEQAQIKAALAAQDRREVLDNLSQIRTRQIWSVIYAQRVGGTANWFTQRPAFEIWLQSTKTSILSCSGSMGVGKSVLVSSIIAHLESARHANVCCHFCQSGHEETLTARGVLGSIVRQFLATSIHRFDGDQLQSLLESSKDVSVNGFVDILELHPPPDAQPYFIILDGLDECSEPEIVTILRELKRLTENPKLWIRLLYSCRSDLESTISRFFRYDAKMPVTKEHTQSDIEKFIEVTLQKCLDEGKLKLSDPELLMRIVKVLEKNHGGMFLWLSLFIEELCIQDNEAGIVDALDHPPKGINELYSRKLLRIRTHRLSKYCSDVIGFTGVARRPLSIEEMREALSVEVDQREFDAKRLPNDMDRIIRACNGLLYVDEGTETLHYVHSSLHLYLFREPSGKVEGFDHRQARLHFSSICLTYLNYSNFTKQVIIAPKSKPSIEPLDIARAQFQSPQTLSSKLIRKMLQSRRSRVSIGSQLSECFLKPTFDDHALHFTFFKYVSENWLKQMMEPVPVGDSGFWKRLRRCLENTDLDAWKPWRNMSGDDMHELTELDKVAIWAITNRHNTLILYCTMDSTAIVYDKIWKMIFEYTIGQSEEFIVAVVRNCLKTRDTRLCMVDVMIAFLFEANLRGLRKLITVNMDADPTTMILLQPILLLATSQENWEAVDMLLAVGTNPNAVSDNGETPLYQASTNGHLKVVKALIRAGADPNYNQKRDTPLYQAATWGHLKIVKALLQAGADVNSTNERGQTPLHQASIRGHLRVVDMILVAGANVDTANKRGATPLYQASYQGQLDIVRMLLAAGAKIDAANDWGSTPLFSASTRGHVEVAKVLLQAGARIDAADNSGRTPLSQASEQGHTEVVRILLAAGADGGTLWNPTQVLQHSDQRSAQSLNQ